MAGGVEYQVTKVDPTDPETKGMVHQVHKVSEEIAATIGGKVYRARIINDPTAPTVAGKVYQIVLIDDPDDPSVKGMVYNAILTGGSEAVVVGPAVSPLSLPDAIADSLSYVKAFGGTEQRNLPQGYTQRNFIYMMDGSYLLTDLVPTYDCKVEMDFETTTLDTGATSYLGGRSAAYPAGLRLGTGSGNSKFVVTAFSASAYTATTSVENNTRYKFTFDNQVATLESGGSTLFTNTFTGTNSNGAALVINGLNSAGTITANTEGIYLYSFKMWNGNGELIADYVPTQNANNEVGFYDMVSKTFKTATAGTFAAGGEAVPTPDAPMDIVCNNGVLKVTHNLFKDDETSYGQGTYWNAQGQLVTSSSYYGSNVIPVTGGKTYIRSETQTNANYFRLSDNTVVNVSSGQTTVTAPDNAVEFFFNIPNQVSPENIKVYEGTSLSPTLYTDGTVETLDINIIEETHQNWSVNTSGVVVTTSSVWGHIVKVEPGKTYYTNIIAANVVLGFFTSKPQLGSTTYNNSRSVTSTGEFTVPNDPTITYALVKSVQNGFVCEKLATAEMLLSVGDYTDEQEVISGAVTRKVGVKVLDGTESWTVASTNVLQADVFPVSSIQPAVGGYCTALSYTDSSTLSGMPENSFRLGSQEYPRRLYVKSSVYATDATTWTNYLTTQYAAGTPVIVVYPLKTATTESVAGQTLQVTDGDNVLEITRASLNGLELEAEYQAAVSLTIQEVQDANLDPNVQVTIN